MCNRLLVGGGVACLIVALVGSLLRPGKTVPRVSKNPLVLLHHCNWSAESTVMYYQSQGDNRQAWPNHTSLAVCHMPDDWVFFRAGPVFTDGNATWVTFVPFVLPPHTLRRFEYENHVWASDHVIAGFDERYRIIPKPPLSVHHIHVAHVPHRETFQTHGDEECDENETHCLVRYYPDDCAFALATNVSFAGSLVDMRPGGSSPLGVFAIAGLRFRPPPNRRLRIVFLTPATHAATGGWKDRNMFRLKTQQDSIIFDSGTVDNMGSIFSAYFHTHWNRISDVWLLRGTVESLGLDTPLYSAARGMPLYGDDVHVRFKRRILSRIGGTTHLICSATEAHVSQSWDYINASIHAPRRQPFPADKPISNCNLSAFENGHSLPWVFVVFFRGDANVSFVTNNQVVLQGLARVDPIVNIQPMHIVMRIEYSVFNESSTLDDYFPSIRFDARDNETHLASTFSYGDDGI